MEYAGTTKLSSDPHTAFFRIWSASPDQIDDEFTERLNCGIIAELLPYRPPHDVIKWANDKPHEYLVMFGRGPAGCPEIYSGDQHYLLSAGGANRGRRSSIIARPTSLMLDDGATDLLNCFQITGQGERNDWNNTGVHRGFACGSKLHVPDKYKPTAVDGNWSVFDIPLSKRIVLVTYGDSRVALMALFPDSSEPARELLNAVVTANPDNAVLCNKFKWPNGDSIGYDVLAPKGKWTIESVNDHPVDRDYDKWPQFSGDMRQTRLTFRRSPDL
jgi:hypothetical protein